jgi:hypothetical protein
MVVECSLMIEVSVCGGMLAMTGSSWGEKVITPIMYCHAEAIISMDNNLRYNF